MKNLPVPVDDDDIEEMFDFADKDNDGKLSYEEFLVGSSIKYCFIFILSFLPMYTQFLYPSSLIIY